MGIKEHQEKWCIILLTKKTGSRMSVNEQLAEGWHKPVNRKLKKKALLGEI